MTDKPTESVTNLGLRNATFNGKPFPIGATVQVSPAPSSPPSPSPRKE